ncbi:hypothetical protein [Actinoplanes sp. L3-i22]|uniref:hypothetical protein n=1 Tax=Actinoplanes sp. L3-i22 TaxID=2836373 RepID=UPI001C77FCF9|nr:hypothetical protein [Actinoplanes sp. L3-i22]BCY07229.1 hypothetical protein L3i22_023170 [Actinoplanes sp. L3-i22]
MSQPGGTLWVDPDGVAAVGESIDRHADLYESYQRRLDSIRMRYQSAWGDDDGGRAFGDRFVDGVDTVDNAIGATKGKLAYAATGLRTAARYYREADDNAQDASHQLVNFFEQPPGSAAAASGAVGGALGGTPLGAAVESPMVSGESAARADIGGVPKSVVGAARPGEGHTLADARLGAAVEDPMIPGVSAARADIAAVPAVAVPLSTGESAARADIPGVPASVVGAVVPPGHRVEALPLQDDGSVLVDVARYHSVAPLSGSFDEHGRQLFAVADNPAVDHTAAGYRPLYLGFPAGDQGHA